MRTKSITANQREARKRNAIRRTCPACKRQSALSTPYELVDDFGRYEGIARTCLYCGHEVGVRNHEPFGRRDLLA